MTQEIRPKSIRHNYIYNLLYEVFALLTPLITTPYISRVLGAEGVGIYSYTYATAQYFVLLGNLGIATYGQMVIAGCRQSRRDTAKAFYELWLLRLIAMLVSLSIYMAVSFYATDYPSARRLLGILLLASVFDLTWFFRGIEDFSKVVLRNFLVKISLLVMIFLLVKTSADVTLYIFLVAISTLLGNLSFLFSIRGLLCKVPIRELQLQPHIRPCLIFFIPTIATSVYTLLDKAMLGVLLEGTSQSGYYEQAHRIEQVLLVTITSLNTIMRSRMAFLYQQGRMEEMHRRLLRSLRFILFLSIPMTAGLIAIAPVFVPWFLGTDFTRSTILVQIFAILLIIIGLSNCLNTHFLGPSGRQGKNNYVLLVGAGVNFLCNCLAIPRYGAVGAAAASVLAEMLILLGYLFLSRDFFSASTLLRLGWRYLLSGIITGCLVTVLSTIIQTTIPLLIAQLLTGIAVYGGVLLLLHDALLRELLGRLRSIPSSKP